MNALIKIIISIILSLFLTSCNFYTSGVTGSGNIITQNRSVTAPFSSIKATEGVEVYISQGTNTNIKIEADDNVIDLIETKINNGELTISTKENIGRALKNVYVEFSNIERLETTSGADLESKGSIKVNNLELAASSGSDIIVEVQATSVTANVSSGADIEIFGTSTTLNATASSGSDIKAESLNTKNVTANASSGGDIKLGQLEIVNIQKSSGGKVSYKGNPQITEN